MEIKITHDLSPSLRDLFWKIFFVDKGRGIAMHRHFPWLQCGASEVILVEATAGGETVGGLVIRKKVFSVGGKRIPVGLIGLVCVAPAMRGRGTAGMLLRAAVLHAQSMDLAYLTLWTNQHYVYQSVGFYVSDPWCYGWVHNDGALDGDYRKIANNFVEDEALPLPPFAIAAYRYSCDVCSVFILEDEKGMVVADYEGKVADVGQFLMDTLGVRWRLNIRAGDELLAVLERSGARTDMQLVNLQMWLSLHEPTEMDPSVSNIPTKFFDRV